MKSHVLDIQIKTVFPIFSVCHMSYFPVSKNFIHDIGVVLYFVHLLAIEWSNF